MKSLTLVGNLSLVSRRPDFTQAVYALMHHVAATTHEFRHIDPSRILIVAGEARRASRGTVKPLCFRAGRRVDSVGRKKPLVKIRGRQVLYSITLRPLFFRRSTARERVATILHELFHIAKEFDGTLDHKRRHAEAGDGFEAEFAPIERRCWRGLPAEIIAPFSFEGEVRVLQWLERPQSWLPGERASQRSVYTERHLFEGIVRMKAKKTKKKSKPASVH